MNKRNKAYSMDKLLEKIKPEQMDDRQEKLWNTSTFLLKMLFAGAIFHLVLFIYPNTIPLQEFLAGITSSLLNVAGMNTVSYGIDIFIGEDIYRITQDCLGWKSMAAFAALTYASTDTFRKHARYLSLGILLITSANIIRILTTIYLSHLNIISFEIIHGTLWKWGLTLFVFIIWLPWFKTKSSHMMSS